jgi:hypothetical protein
LIVVIGVFLGTQANNWNQSRIERQQAREYRSMLIDDLNTNLSNLANRKRYYRWVRGEALATLAALDRPSGQLGEWPGLALDLNRLLVDLDQKLLAVDAIAGRAMKVRADLERVDS